MATIGINYAIGGISMVWRMPVKVYGKLLWRLDGEILLPKNTIRGMLTIGSCHEDYIASSGKAQINISGRWVIGGVVRIGHDCFIGVSKCAELEMGDGTFIGRDSQIHCSNKVKIGRDVFCGETYICDSTVHHILHNGKEKERDGMVVIGDGTYMGFRTMLLKDTQIPPCSVVSSGAVCIKDYGNEEKVLIAGMPAEIIKKDYTATK